MTKILADDYNVAKEQPFMTMPERKIYNKWRLRILISIIFGYGTY